MPTSKACHLLTACLLVAITGEPASVRAQDAEDIRQQLDASGARKFREGNFDGAIADYTRAIQVAPISWLYEHRAEARHAKGDYDGAIADYSQALTLTSPVEGRVWVDRIWSRAYYGRSLSKKAKGDFAGAAADRAKALEMDPSASFIFERAQGEEIGGHVEQAITYYTYTLDLNPKEDLAYWKRAKLLEKKGELNGALADFDKAIQLKPTDATYYLERGTLLQKKGDHAAAAKDFNRAVELKPDDAKALLGRGISLSRSGDHASAMPDFARALELDPKNANVYYYRAGAKDSTGDLKGALADYNRAVELRPESAQLFHRRGALHYRMRSFTDALSDIRRSCELKYNAEAYSRLYIWVIRARLGEAAQANEELAAYLARRWDAQPGDWTVEQGNFLIGKTTEEALFAAARKVEKPADQKGRMCEAWYFAGMKKLLAGDKQTAAEYFTKCLATEVDAFDEYKFAAAELNELRK